MPVGISCMTWHSLPLPLSLPPPLPLSLPLVQTHSILPLQYSPPLVEPAAMLPISWYSISSFTGSAHFCSVPPRAHWRSHASSDTVTHLGLHENRDVCQWYSYALSESPLPLSLPPVQTHSVQYSPPLVGPAAMLPISWYSGSAHFCSVHPRAHWWIMHLLTHSLILACMKTGMFVGDTIMLL